MTGARPFIAELPHTPTRRQDPGPLMLRTRAHPATPTVVLAALIGLAVVGCGPAERLAPAPHVVAASPSNTPRSPGSRVVTEAPPGQPNVLVIETDDMRWDDLRWMPNVRRLLQRKGLTFE